MNTDSGTQEHKHIPDSLLRPFISSIFSFITYILLPFYFDSSMVEVFIAYLAFKPFLFFFAQKKPYFHDIF